MIVCEPEPAGDNVVVPFTVGEWVLEGKQLWVVGDFNDWRTARITFEPRSTGRRQATAVLQSGHLYRFRYLRSDGTWLNEESADGYVDNEHGGHDSILDLTDLTPAQDLSLNPPVFGRQHWEISASRITRGANQAHERTSNGCGRGATRRSSGIPPGQGWTVALTIPRV